MIQDPGKDPIRIESSGHLQMVFGRDSDRAQTPSASGADVSENVRGAPATGLDAYIPQAPDYRLLRVRAAPPHPPRVRRAPPRRGALLQGARRFRSVLGTPRRVRGAPPGRTALPQRAERSLRARGAPAACGALPSRVLGGTSQQGAWRPQQGAERPPSGGWALTHPAVHWALRDSDGF